MSPIFSRFNFTAKYFKAAVLLLLLVGILQTLADVFDWYYIFPHLDTPMHILGGMFIGSLALAYIPRHYNDFQKLCWVIGMVILAGLVVEVGEWILTAVFRVEIGFLLQPSVMDTIGDMIHDFVGGIIVFVYAYFNNQQ